MAQLLLLVAMLWAVSAEAGTKLLLMVDELHPINVSAFDAENLGQGAQTFDFHFGDLRYQCDNADGGAPDDCNAPTTVGFRFPAGTFRNLSFQIAPNDTSCTHTATLYKNGSATTLTCQIVNVSPNGLTRGSCADTTHSVAVTAGDQVLLRLEQDASCSFGNASPGQSRQGVSPQAQVEFEY